MWPTRGVILTAAVVVGAILFPGTASGTSATGVQGTDSWRTSSDGTDYVFRQITIAPGGFS